MHCWKPCFTWNLNVLLFLPELILIVIIFPSTTRAYEKRRVTNHLSLARSEHTPASVTQRRHSPPAAAHQDTRPLPLLHHLRFRLCVRLQFPPPAGPPHVLGQPAERGEVVALSVVRRELLGGGQGDGGRRRRGGKRDGAGPGAGGAAGERGGQY